jgi:aminopeptidase N
VVEETTYGVGAAGIGDAYYPTLGNGGYDVTHYDLDLEIGTDGRVSSSVVIDARSTEDLVSFNLDFAGWEIERLDVNGEPATFERSGHELAIGPVDLTAGEAFTVVIHYAGVPVPTQSAAIPFGIGWFAGPAGEHYVAAEPDAAHTWFPSNDHPLDKATFAFAVTVPNGFTAAANGELVDVVEHETTTTYSWVMADPMATYLATIVVGDDLEIVDDPVSTAAAGIPIRNVLPPDLEPAQRAVLETTGEMVRALEIAFGPYPFDRYGIANVEGLAAALENQTLSVFGRAMVDAPYFEYVLVHELAHQWFGDSVSLGQWSDIWLNEGFATFAELLWVEHLYGPGAYREEVANRMEAARIAAYGPPGIPPPDDLFNGTVYQRGAFVLVALRDEVGDDLFFDTVRAYVERYTNGNVTTDDFIAVAEEISGRNLTELFDTWLYGELLPE